MKNFLTLRKTVIEDYTKNYPTVKPLSLMRYLCRLITPPGGTILDPFAGSGTTGEAAVLEGFHPIMIEMESEYLTDIRNRMAAAEPDEMVPKAQNVTSLDALFVD